MENEFDALSSMIGGFVNLLWEQRLWTLGVVGGSVAMLLALVWYLPYYPKKVLQLAYAEFFGLCVIFHGVTMFLPRVPFSTDLWFHLITAYGAACVYVQIPEILGNAQSLCRQHSAHSFLGWVPWYKQRLDAAHEAQCRIFCSKKPVFGSEEESRAYTAKMYKHALSCLQRIIGQMTNDFDKEQVRKNVVYYEKALEDLEGLQPVAPPESASSDSSPETSPNSSLVVAPEVAV